MAGRQDRPVALNDPGTLGDRGGLDGCLACLKAMMSQGCHGPALRCIDAILHFALVEVAGLTARTRALDMDMLAWRKREVGWMEGKMDGWKARMHERESPNDKKGTPR